MYLGGQLLMDRYVIYHIFVLLDALYRFTYPFYDAGDTTGRFCNLPLHSLDKSHLFWAEADGNYHAELSGGAGVIVHVHHAAPPTQYGR